MDLFDLEPLREAIDRAIKKAPEVALQSKLDMLLGIGRNPATGRIERNLRPLFDREALEKNRKIIDIIESTGFKELEERMRRSARQMGKSFKNIEARMLITTAAERAEFFKYGRSPVQSWLDDAGYPWPKPNVAQIDKDYAKYCEDLDNRPNFLAWCISRAYRSVAINKTTNLGATKLWKL